MVFRLILGNESPSHSAVNQKSNKQIFFFFFFKFGRMHTSFFFLIDVSNKHLNWSDSEICLCIDFKIMLECMLTYQ